MENQSNEKKLISLNGILKNPNISDEDVEEAKKSLFKTEWFISQIINRIPWITFILRKSE